MGLGFLIGWVAWGLTDSDSFGLFIGSSSVVLAWMVAACVLWRATPLETIREARPAATGDSTAEVVCPRCRYVLNGLREARCPECGEQYTLDQLLTAQQPDGRLADA